MVTCQMVTQLRQDSYIQVPKWPSGLLTEPSDWDARTFYGEAANSTAVLQ